MMRHPIPIPIGVRGRVRWQVYGPHGKPVPVVATYPSGRQRLLTGGHWSPNLITNGGLDAMFYGERTWLTTWPKSNRLRTWLRVGTGSTEPDVTDTALDAQVQSNDGPGSFTEYEVNGVQDGTDFTIQVLQRRLITLSADRNLTEYGYGRTSADSDLCIRELFRDEFGDPVTLSLLNGNFLRVDHTMEIVVDLARVTGSFDVDEYDAADEFVGSTTVDYEAGIWTRGFSGDATAVKARHLIAALSSIGFGRRSLSTSQQILDSTVVNPTMPAAFSGTGVPTGFTARASSHIPGASYTYDAYTPGSYERTARMNLAVGNLNQAWTGFGCRWNGIVDGQSNRGGGFIVCFRNSDTFTKADTHTLQWAWKFSVARATEGP